MMVEATARQRYWRLVLTGALLVPLLILTALAPVAASWPAALLAAMVLWHASDSGQDRRNRFLALTAMVALVLPLLRWGLTA